MAGRRKQDRLAGYLMRRNSLLHSSLASNDEDAGSNLMNKREPEMLSTRRWGEMEEEQEKEEEPVTKGR